MTTPKDYQKAAEQTSALLLGDQNFRLAVAGLGLVGECGELVKADLGDCSMNRFLEEAGGVLWYVAEIWSAMGSEWRILANFEWKVLHETLLITFPVWTFEDLRDQASVAAENIKKHVAHEQDLAFEIDASLCSILAILALMCEDRGCTLGHVARYNLQQLAERHLGGKFDPAYHDTKE